MQRLIPALALMLLAGGALAAPKPCEELKQEIEVKIQAKAIPSYTLEIITAEEAKNHDSAMIVGTCENGTKRIIYQKNND